MVKIFSLLADLQEENARLREALAHAISLLPPGPTRRDLQAVLASEQGGG